MRFDQVVLHDIALSLPEEAWTSDSIEQRFAETYRRMRLSVGRLELMTGIRERRVWPEGFLPSVEAGRVGRTLLERGSFPLDRIGLLIHCGVCRDRLEPATASYVHRHLGLAPQVQVMDISNACLGFVNGMMVAASMIESRQIEAAMLVTAENSRGLLENTIRQMAAISGSDRNAVKPLFANLTIGSGAVAAIVCRRGLASGIARVSDAVVRTNSSHNDLCEGGASQGGDGHEMLTDSEALLQAGIALAREAWGDFIRASGWTLDSIAHTIAHQVGKMHQAALYDALAIDRNRDYSTYPTLGNMGSAALPGTLARACEAGIFQSGEHVALLGIGSGITSIMAGLEWL